MKNLIVIVMVIVAVCVAAPALAGDDRAPVCQWEYEFIPLDGATLQDRVVDFAQFILDMRSKNYNAIVVGPDFEYVTIGYKICLHSRDLYLR